MKSLKTVSKANQNRQMIVSANKTGGKMFLESGDAQNYFKLINQGTSTPRQKKGKGSYCRKEKYPELRASF